MIYYFIMIRQNDFQICCDGMNPGLLARSVCLRHQELNWIYGHLDNVRYSAQISNILPDIESASGSTGLSTCPKILICQNSNMFVL
jgi:hypothetical protein